VSDGEGENAAPRSLGERARERRDIARWRYHYAKQWPRAHWRLRGVQRLGVHPIVGGKPHVEVTDCQIGDRFKIWSTHRETMLAGWGRIRIGDDVFINSGSIVFSVLELTIGDGVALAPEVYITDTNSHGMEGRDPIDAPVHIGAGTWVGARAIILPGVTIGRRVMVAAGSVVSRSVPDDVLVAGNPARVIRPLSYPPYCLRAWHDGWCRCPDKPGPGSAPARHEALAEAT
jgi:acetyltransferase-like isoleucine patch superfamily enzyme